MPDRFGITAVARWRRIFVVEVGTGPSAKSKSPCRSPEITTLKKFMWGRMRSEGIADCIVHGQPAYRGITGGCGRWLAPGTLLISNTDIRPGFFRSTGVLEIHRQSSQNVYELYGEPIMSRVLAHHRRPPQGHPRIRVHAFRWSISF